jgi:hypothetical protein
MCLGELLNDRLEIIKEYLLNQIENGSSKDSIRLKHLEMWIWITKAMVLREHNSFNQLSMKVYLLIFFYMNFPRQK